jgi:hypothetical protein
LRTELLPTLIESRRSSRALRYWSAACSTGQEGYSLAMLMQEHFPLLVNWDIRIEGTDLCAEVVERAQAGRYQRIEINRGLPARFVVRYFNRVGEDWVVKPELGKLCHFRRANLCAPVLPFNRASDRFDIIFLRNVMLYFSQQTRKTLLAGIHRLLAPDRPRRYPLPRLQRTTRRPHNLDLRPRRRYLLLQAQTARLKTRSRERILQSHMGATEGAGSFSSLKTGPNIAAFRPGLRPPEASSALVPGRLSHERFSRSEIRACLRSH